MDEKFYRRFLSFCKSLDALAEARQRDLTDSFVLSGTSAKFSITFDLAWKVMKDILIHDYDCEIVKTHCSTIVEKYIDLFYDFEKVVKQLEM